MIRRRRSETASFAGYRFPPEVILLAVRWYLRYGLSWSVDETYVRVAGVWRYVYRAVDRYGQVIDVFVSKRRNVAAATKFFEAMLAGRERCHYELGLDPRHDRLRLAAAFDEPTATI